MMRWIGRLAGIAAAGGIAWYVWRMRRTEPARSEAQAEEVAASRFTDAETKMLLDELKAQL